MDWRYRQYLDVFPESREDAQEALSRAMAEFPYWGQLASLLADTACDRMDEAEKRHLWHKAMGREEKAADALQSMEFYRQAHWLAHLIRHTRMVSNAPGVVAAVVARHANLGDKSKPIDAETVDDLPVKRGQK